MSFLTPLYALGLLAVAAPIVFHLIRRTPRGDIPFSSLMFLSPTPPRLTRRSRLDDWLLLLLRASALVLLAAAFTRPFLRQQALADPARPGDGGSPYWSTPARACGGRTCGRGPGPWFRRSSPRACRPIGSPCSRSTSRPGRCSGSRNRPRSTRPSSGRPSRAGSPRSSRRGERPTWAGRWSTPRPRSATWRRAARRSPRPRGGSS